jgi:protease-4
VFKYRLIALAIICIIIASGLSIYYFYTGLAARRNLIGIISIEGPILTSEDADKCLEAINNAITNNTVKAVVLRIDSPGGYADLVEQIYLDLLELKRVKPVIASVTLALSGGYYIAVAADYIYVEPTSSIGNVGVIGVMPPILIPSETVIETGVFKATGFSRLLFPFNLTHALESFTSAVVNSRGDKLKISVTELKRGMVYLGSEALKIGLADDIGSLQKAISKAAEKAGIVQYEAASLMLRNSTLSQGMMGWRDLTVKTLNTIHPPPSIWYLYLPSSQAGLEEDMVETSGSRAGLVVVDKSHGNIVSEWDLDILIAELAKRNITLGFASDWSSLKSMLNNASCLIIASPTRSYSMSECSDIEEFVGRGGMLLLFFDPSYEYVEIPKLFGPINSIANRFGLSFAKGYLYNEEKHYGFYRNIYITGFRESPVTRNISSIVFFTSTYIHNMNSGVAWTSNNTYSSTAEKSGRYDVIAFVKRNGTVIALGDQTFLKEPYCYVEDNYKLILNLVSEIMNVKIAVKAEEKVEDKEIAKPNIPTGTVKEFIEEINGDTHLLKWVKISDQEIVVERPNMVMHYYYSKDGKLVKYTSNGMEIIYDDPIPPPPYPLSKGKSWRYESSYTLHMGGEKYIGKYVEECYVEEIQYIYAANKTYLCAKVSFKTKDRFNVSMAMITITANGFSWISSEIGEVKEDYVVQYYMDEALTQEMNVKIILKSIQTK